MPARKDVFVKGGFYHIFNQAIDKRLVFEKPGNCRRFLEACWYYRSKKTVLSFSKWRKLDIKIQEKEKRVLSLKKNFRVDILAFCLMPTHFHFLLRQIDKKGISTFVANLLNSFTRYFNLRFERKGPLFLPMFRSNMIRDDSQLMHVSRYIHLNPYSGSLVKNIKDLKHHPWSSYGEYIRNGNKGLCNTKTILKLFDQSRSDYQQFVNDRANYQRTLASLKYLEKLEIFMFRAI